MYGDLWVGVDAQFRIKLVNSTYTECYMEVTGIDGEPLGFYSNIKDFCICTY